jgi:hypothetical protein
MLPRAKKSVNARTRTKLVIFKYEDRKNANRVKRQLAQRIVKLKLTIISEFTGWPSQVAG